MGDSAGEGAGASRRSDAAGAAGLEAGRRVAYQDEGTMVVVDHAKRRIGQNVDGAGGGGMIVARLNTPADQDALSVARG